MRHVLLVSALVLAATGCAGATPPPAHGASVEGSAKTTEAKPREQRGHLELGREHLGSSRYDEAEAEFRAALAGDSGAAARLGLAETLLMTGRYEDAVDMAGQVASAASDLGVAAATLQARALRRQGKLEEAERVLRAVQTAPGSNGARLLLGEILLEEGRRADAEPVLMTLIEAYRTDEIRDDDGPGMALVGRAAHMLRSAEDANEAFNLAELAQPGFVPTLLWRADLFLEKHDPGHAEEVIAETLQRAPHHPDALVAMAHVKLAQTYDFAAAGQLAQQALDVDPRHAGARFVKAGIELRDMNLARADAEIDAGLAHNPRDLPLLSLRATVRFLADDQQGFVRAREKVFGLNREYARFFEIVGEYAEWEHRYDEIVEMMRSALLVDPEDPNARAELGINLLRAGYDERGVRELDRAFERDPFNVRVFNTLRLYEEIIPEAYVTVERGVFRIRYPRDGQELLDRYVPRLLEEAFDGMVQRYGFTPQTPVGVELYPNREHFAVRTVGLPNTGIQGVCFGRTFASMSPGQEKFNLGMTLWHELSHVFHIQRSRSRVPRWFTEGLAEWETLTARQEWRRELDPELYEALRMGRIPHIEGMNRAFTHAEDMEDMATAYYASTKILTMFAQRYGIERVSQMLRLWGAGKRTPEVLHEALGVDPQQLDKDFRDFAAQQLDRYAKQFVPIRRTGSLESARRTARERRDSPRAQAAYALALSREGKQKQAAAVVRAARKQHSLDPDLQWVSARLAMVRDDREQARRVVEQLVADGHDGFEVEMLRAELAEARNDLAATESALRSAHQFDPQAEEPLGHLAHLARETKRRDQEIDALRKFVRIDQDEPRAYQRLLRLLIDTGQPREAVEVGAAAIYVDMTGLLTHQLYAEALASVGKKDQAVFELESALLCPARPGELADAHAQLAGTLLEQGKRAAAQRHAQEARKLDPDNARLRKLSL